MKLTLDVENTVTERNGKMHLDPFESGNQLIMVGMLTDNGKEYLYRMDDDKVSYYTEIQNALDKTTLLIGHNIVYDLMWLWECGFKYDGVVFDTMLGEYILQRGIKEPLSLEACAERYNLSIQKDSTLKDYFKQGKGVDEIPKGELAHYLSCDLKATQEFANKLMYKLNTVEDGGLLETVLFTNRVALTLAKIYQRGFKVDKDALHNVKTEFKEEKHQIVERLSSQVKELMGDTPINLNSPEQMSWVIFSRKPKNKELWQNSYSPYMEKKEFISSVKSNSDILYKTKATKCFMCNGKGLFRKTKKDGKPYAKETRCEPCDGKGYHFTKTEDVAGLKFFPPNAKWVSANGFSVSKTNLDVIQHVAKHRDMKKAEKFLEDLKRLSALDTYLSSFVEGIQTHLKDDGLLHVRLLQHRTATGRFSGADPNMQNMPRGGTFPVKKVFISRWKGGKIVEADFAQLEFRTAAFLSQDEVARKEIRDGFDVHSYTAKVITDAGQPTTRQEGKSHTFAPLYGATGFGRSLAEAEYYKNFTEKYKGIALWHSRLAKEAVETGKIKTPSGREFNFPNVKRLSSGKVTNFTQIKNYPVQSFATADIVPLILMKIDERLDKLRSCVVNTVHDSIVIDMHPDEIDAVLSVLKNVNRDMQLLINQYFKIKLNVPLTLDVKMGENWLDTKEIL